MDQRYLLPERLSAINIAALRNDCLTKATNKKKDGHVLWTDEELALAVETYVQLLRLQNSGVAYGGEPVVQALLGLRLVRRNEASIRYRMRNISNVVSDLGQPFLQGFSPAAGVGSGVNQRIRALLMADSSFNEILGAQNSVNTSQASTSDILSTLRASVNELERELVGIGHNGPPEPISAELQREIFAEANDDITEIEEQVESAVPSAEIVNKRITNLTIFVSKLANWAGQRATVFIDASLKVAAPLVIAKILGLMPAIISIAEAVAKVTIP